MSTGIVSALTHAEEQQDAYLLAKKRTALRNLLYHKHFHAERSKIQKKVQNKIKEFKIIVKPRKL